MLVCHTVVRHSSPHNLNQKDGSRLGEHFFHLSESLFFGPGFMPLNPGYSNIMSAGPRKDYNGCWCIFNSTEFKKFEWPPKLCSGDVILHSTTWKDKIKGLDVVHLVTISFSTLCLIWSKQLLGWWLLIQPMCVSPDIPVSCNQITLWNIHLSFPVVSLYKTTVL